jgi:hypothetical protein
VLLPEWTAEAVAGRGWCRGDHDHGSGGRRRRRSLQEWYGLDGVPARPGWASVRKKNQVWGGIDKLHLWCQALLIFMSLILLYLRVPYNLLYVLCQKRIIVMYC